ncbi:MAG: sporulation protein YqfD [Firmicutes bacterium]|nr:sporulation protein YqfD [Bacillota bacterium]
MRNDPGRIISGWLTVEIWGKRPESLLNLALKEGLSLTDVRWLGPGRLEAQLTPEDLRRLRPLTRRARCRLRIRRRQGLPFLLAAARRRPLLPLAILLFIPLLAFLSSLVAEVEVTSPYALDPREEALVYQLAREAGVEAGRSRWGMDLEATEKAILRGFPRLFYAEILRHGNRLEIAVVRRIDVPAGEEIRPPGDLVASAPGIIIDALVQRGTAAVATGDTVRQGQVLISGAYAGDYLGAAGIVTARVFGEGYGECYLEEVQLRETGRVRQQVRLALGEGPGALFAVSGPDVALGFRRESRRQLLLWRKIPLPVEVILIEIAEVDPVRVRRTPEQARLYAAAQARRRAWEKLAALAGEGLLAPARYSQQLIDLGDGVIRVRVLAESEAEIGSFRPLSEAELRQWRERSGAEQSIER